MSEGARACWLGLVQGLTEFLPVSSDGHLALFHAFFGGGRNALAMDVVLHCGTLLAMVIFFRSDVLLLVKGGLAPSGSKFERRRLLMIFVTSFVTGVIGLSLKDTVEKVADSLPAAGVGFLATAAVLAWGERRSRSRSASSPEPAHDPAKRPSPDPLSGKEGMENEGTSSRGLSKTSLTMVEAPLSHAAWIGLVQGAAVWPGLSRSASTIALALALGWRWEEAGRYSFLAAMPAIAGATLLTAREIRELPLLPSVVGFTVSFLTGWLALGLLMRFLRARRLWPFSLYAFGLGIVVLAAFR